MCVPVPVLIPDKIQCAPARLRFPGQVPAQHQSQSGRLRCSALIRFQKVAVVQVQVRWKIPFWLQVRLQAQLSVGFQNGGSGRFRCSSQVKFQKVPARIRSQVLV